MATKPLTRTEALKRAGLPTFETLVRRIVTTFDRATMADVESGARWYDEAGELASSLAHRAGSRERAAAVISHLSPRTSWSRNVAGAVALIDEGPAAAREIGCIGSNIDRAVKALASTDPLDSFGPTAPKTRAFAANIAGDREAITVDVWAARVVGMDEALLSRVGIYEAIADAYRAAARRRGVDPATMQATTWIVARNGRAL